jgi:flagellar biosynthesis chaperone FliJ
MVELTRDVRKVIKKTDGNFVFVLDQEQVYDQATVENMVKSWKAQREQYNTFLGNYDKTIEEGIETLKKQMELQKQKVLTELKHIEEGLALWENPETEATIPLQTI